MQSAIPLGRAVARGLVFTLTVAALGCGSRSDTGTGPSAVAPDAVAAQPGGPDPSRSLSVTCSGYGCDNKDPIATGCSAGATTVSTKTIYRNGTTTAIGYVSLRWSNTCQTNWSQLTRYSGCAEYMDATVERSSPYKIIHEQLTGYCQIYTDMVYASGITARACGLIDESWTSGYGCTGWF